MLKFLMVLVAALVMAAPAAAHDAGSVQHKNKFLRSVVADKYGDRAPGRNVVTRGMADGSEATMDEVREYFGTLRRMAFPPVPAVQPVPAVSQASAPAVGVAAPAAPAAAVTPAGGGGGPEQFVECESGGDWNAVNPSSGARGRYQIMPFHYGGNGMCRDLGWDQGGQTACANRIYETQGSGAWSQCGG